MKVKKLWSYNYDEPILGFQIADINNNGNKEIITNNKTGRAFIISLDGQLLHEELISKDKPIWHLRVFDIDNDGENELILGGMDGFLRTFKCNLKYDLQILWEHRFNSSISGILIEDINNDNYNEIIGFSLDNTIRVLNSSNGSLIWGQIFQDGVGDVTIFKNDKIQLLGAGNDGTIRVFNGLDGKLQWFKQFSDKIRCACFLKSIKGWVVLCGGDDKKLHFIDLKTQNEIKTKEFENYIWKCKPYPFQKCKRAIISSYSFDYFSESISTKNINFSSKITCINEYLEYKWEIKGLNTECLYIIDISNNILICVGTTKGDLIIIEEKTGEILFNETYSSCLNSIQFNMENKLLISCFDDGTIVTYNVVEF